MTTPQPPDSNPYAIQPPYPPPPYQPPFGQVPAPAGNNPLAIAGMVVGIISICAAIIACLGIVLGGAGAALSHVALSQIKKSGQNGRGMALAGVICGWIGFGLGVINAIAGAALKINGVM